MESLCKREQVGGRRSLTSGFSDAPAFGSCGIQGGANQETGEAAREHVCKRFLDCESNSLVKMDHENIGKRRNGPRVTMFYSYGFAL